MPPTPSCPRQAGPVALGSSLLPPLGDPVQPLIATHWSLVCPEGGSVGDESLHSGLETLYPETEPLLVPGAPGRSRAWAVKVGSFMEVIVEQPQSACREHPRGSGPGAPHFSLSWTQSCCGFSGPRTLPHLSLSSWLCLRLGRRGSWGNILLAIEEARLTGLAWGSGSSVCSMASVPGVGPPAHVLGTATRILGMGRS